MGLAGTAQALLTPDLAYDFPSYYYFQFWVQHCGIVLAALLLVAGWRLHPRARAVPRLVVITVAFTLIVRVADITTGGNYMYLRHKPPGGSLLDYLGPWPVYLVSGVPLVIFFLVVLDLPFWAGRGRARHRALPEERGQNIGVTALDLFSDPTRGGSRPALLLPRTCRSGAGRWSRAA